MHIRPSRFVLPELNQIAVFPIDDAYRIANINNIQQNFVLHRQIDINPTTNEVNGFMILGTDIFYLGLFVVNMFLEMVHLGLLPNLLSKCILSASL